MEHGVWSAEAAAAARQAAGSKQQGTRAWKAARWSSAGCAWRRRLMMDSACLLRSGMRSASSSISLMNRALTLSLSMT